MPVYGVAHRAMADVVVAVDCEGEVGAMHMCVYALMGLCCLNLSFNRLATS